MMRRTGLLGLLAISLFAIVACQDSPTVNTAPSDSAAITAASTTTAPEIAVAGSSAAELAVATAVQSLPPTEPPPSPTPAEPMAALVNDEPIFLSTYEKELARHERAQAQLGLLTEGEEPQGYRSQVLDALVERVLISQAAAEQGIVITSAMVNQKLAELQTAAGDSGNFIAWLEANLWTEDEFREALATEMITEQIVAIVTADVPWEVEQVRARYLQVDDLALAESLLQQIRNGADFAALAETYSLDRVTGQNGGELGGYFARGSLLVPSVEAAAFSLEVGEVSEIITGTTGDSGQTTYYLVQLIDRDPKRQLSADLRYTLLQQAFENWLQAQWQQATIVRMINTDA